MLSVIFLIPEILFSVSGGITMLPCAPDDSMPFIVKVEVSGLDANASYNCGLWIYGKPAVSQVWTEKGWKGGYRYTAFTSDSSSKWTAFKPLRIVKPFASGYDYYIKCTVKDNKKTKLIEDKRLHSEGFNIFNDGGWIKGRVFTDTTFTKPLKGIAIIARDKAKNIMGAYISEDNKIEEDGALSPGEFILSSPSGMITCIIFEDIDGSRLGEINGEWNISTGDTTGIGNISIFR
jgi:hypothetical protein